MNSNDWVTYHFLLSTKLKKGLELSKHILLKVISSVGDFLAYGLEVVKQTEKHCYNKTSIPIYSYE